MFLIDSHCHINYFKNQEIQDFLRLSEVNKVKVLHNISVNISKFAEIIAPCLDYNNIFCSIANHPCDIADVDVDADASKIKKFLKQYNDKIIGIGETGLDKYREENALTLNKQIESFESSIEISNEFQKPVSVHTRSAAKETIDVIKNHVSSVGFTGLIHCFSEDIEFARKVLDMGLYISFSGIVTFKNAVAIQDTLKFVPMDRILIETDSPYLAPVPFRGKRNNPSYVYHVAERVSEIKNISLEEVGRVTTSNFLKLFKIDESSLHQSFFRE